MNSDKTYYSKLKKAQNFKNYMFQLCHTWLQAVPLQ